MQVFVRILMAIILFMPVSVYAFNMTNQSDLALCAHVDTAEGGWSPSGVSGLIEGGQHKSGWNLKTKKDITIEACFAQHKDQLCLGGMDVSCFYPSLVKKECGPHAAIILKTKNSTCNPAEKSCSNKITIECE